MCVQGTNMMTQASPEKAIPPCTHKALSHFLRLWIEFVEWENESPFLNNCELFVLTLRKKGKVFKVTAECFKWLLSVHSSFQYKYILSRLK